MTQNSLGDSVVQKAVQSQQVNNGVLASATQTQPLWLLAEVTYRCPLHCAFCYNPTDYDKHTPVSYTHLDVYKRQHLSRTRYGPAARPDW